MEKIKRLWVIIILLFFCSRHVYAQTIDVYTYHDHPPFINATNKGLTYDLQHHLNNQKGKYTFVVHVLPRSRLNMMLSGWISGDCLRTNKICDNNWMVIWVNPKWGFGTDATSKYFWVKIHDDSNSIISLKKNRISYQSPESLSGLRFGGMRGHRYLSIDKLVKEKKIIRIDGNKERDNISKLLLERVDAILLPTSTIDYYMSKDPTFVALDEKLYIAPQKHHFYTRYVMIPGNNAALFQWVEAFMDNAKDWNLILQQNNLLSSTN